MTKLAVCQQSIAEGVGRAHVSNEPLNEQCRVELIECRAREELVEVLTQREGTRTRKVTVAQCRRCAVSKRAHAGL